MTFTLPETVPTDKKKMVELRFEVKRPATITVNGQKATAFRFGDALEIDGAAHFFHVKEGKGRFFGHISYEKERWLISIRTLQRESKLVIELWESPSHEGHCPHRELRLKQLN